MYCVNCGKELKPEAEFCPKCGEQVVRHQPAGVSPELDYMAQSLAKGSLGAAKGLAAVLCAGMGIASLLAALAMFCISAYLVYHFAAGTAVAVPWFLLNALPFNSVSGAGLILGGATAALLAVLLGMAGASLLKCLSSARDRAGRAHEI